MMHSGFSRLLGGFSRLLGLVALVALTAATTPAAHAQLGVAAGLNFDSFSDIEGTNAASIDNATGYHLGVFVDLAAGPLAIRPGVFYRFLGEIEPDFDLGAVSDPSFDLNMIDVPIDLRFRVLPLPLVKPYVFGGPVLMFAQTDDPDFRDNLKDFTVAGNVGLGVELSPPMIGLTLYPELRYSFGLSSFMEDELVFQSPGGPITVNPDNSQRISTIMLRLGVKF